MKTRGKTNLRVHQNCLGRRQAEQRRVKPVHAVQEAAEPHERQAAFQGSVGHPAVVRDHARPVVVAGRRAGRAHRVADDDDRERRALWARRPQGGRRQRACDGVGGEVLRIVKVGLHLFPLLNPGSLHPRLCLRRQLGLVARRQALPSRLCRCRRRPRRRARMRAFLQLRGDKRDQAVLRKNTAGQGISCNCIFDTIHACDRRGYHLLIDALRGPLYSTR